MNLQTEQNGIALPLTLIILFVLTLVGVASLRTTLFEEDMTTNSRLRQIAFNAAESALREAENHMIQTTVNQRNEDGPVPDIRSLFFAGNFPSEDVDQPGDVCTNGYCTPIKQDSSGQTLTEERWNDPNLDVWDDPDKHRVYSNFEASELAQEGIYDAPRYIIEYLGNFEEKIQGKFQTNCPTDPATGKVLAPNDKWPFCPSDPASYRITVRATAGPTSRQAVITLQSTIRIP